MSHSTARARAWVHREDIVRGLRAIVHLQRGGTLERSCPVCVYTLRVVPVLSLRIPGINDTTIDASSVVREVVEFDWRAA